MFADELERLERVEQRRDDPRETRRMLPVDSHSQLGTGYTGREEMDAVLDGDADNERSYQRWRQIRRKRPADLV